MLSFKLAKRQNHLSEFYERTELGMYLGGCWISKVDDKDQRIWLQVVNIGWQLSEKFTLHDFIQFLNSTRMIFKVNVLPSHIVIEMLVAKVIVFQTW